MAQNPMKIGNYILMETLGVGSFGKVKRMWIIHYFNIYIYIYLNIYMYIIFKKLNIWEINFI